MSYYNPLVCFVQSGWQLLDAINPDSNTIRIGVVSISISAMGDGCRSYIDPSSTAIWLWGYNRREELCKSGLCHFRIDDIRGKATQYDLLPIVPTGSYKHAQALCNVHNCEMIS